MKRSCSWGIFVATMVGLGLILSACDIEPGDYTVYRTCPLGENEKSLGMFILYVAPEEEQEVGNPTQASTDLETTNSEDETDITCNQAGTTPCADVDFGAIDDYEFDLMLPSTLCQGATSPEGELVYVALGLDADFPANDPEHYYQYGLVFETDNDPANDYVPDPMYPADFFTATDHWYQLLGDPATGWSLSAQVLVGGVPADVATDATVAAVENSLFFLIPAAELGDPANISFRLSAFRHDGGWLMGDWNADVVPPVSEGLIPLLP